MPVRGVESEGVRVREGEGLELELLGRCGRVSLLTLIDIGSDDIILHTAQSRDTKSRNVE